MTRMLTLEVSQEIDQSLSEESRRTGKSREQVALEWIGDHVHRPERGTVEALMPSFGTWSMSPGERTDIEQMIEEERLFEDGER